MNVVIFEFDIDGEHFIFKLCEETDSTVSCCAFADGDEWVRANYPSRALAIEAAEELRQTLEAQRGNRVRTARHEAAHAVAALHFNIPFKLTTLRRRGAVAGTTPMAPREPLAWVVAICCGPLAEQGWDDFSDDVRLAGTDAEQVANLGLQFNQRLACELEAVKFVSNPEVRQQIDRVAKALLERRTLAPDDVIEIAQFGQRLCSAEWQ
jgi:hypothetical protein